MPRTENTTFDRRRGFMRCAIWLILLANAKAVFAGIERDEHGNLFEYTHATMSDGVKIALAISYPEEFDPSGEGKKWPVIMEMSGYPWQTKPPSHEGYGGLYVAINVSLRGTGASGGTFSFMSDRSIRDGHELIEQWIVKQPWSNGKVGITGHSWSGLTGFRIAATNPPHLTTLVVSGLFDDSIRGLAGIGGIRNVGFPMQWVSNFNRTDGVFGSDQAAIENRDLDESEHREIQKNRKNPNTVSSNADQNLPRTLRSIAADIQTPIYLMHSYQDHETGPSGAWLFDYLPDDITKRMLISNGHHGMPLRFLHLRRAWFDYWLRGERSDIFPDVDQRAPGVQAFFEVENRLMVHNPPWISSDFPLPETQWTRYYLNPSKTLSTVQENQLADSTSNTYEVESAAPDNKIDNQEFRLTFDEPTAICGPIALTLWASSTAEDADFFSLLSDIAPDGRVRHLQRGMLRGSLRAIDEEMSNWINIEGERVLIRPYHSLNNPQPLTPGKPYRFEIEIPPTGHVFRKGHQLMLTVSRPPENDPVPYPWGRRKKAIIKSGSFKYESNQPDSTVTIHQSAELPSSILLPLMPTLPPISKNRPALIELLWDHKE